MIMGAIATQITSLTIVYSTVYSGADQRKHQSSASLAFVLGIHRSPVNSQHKWPVTRKMFPFDDVIMTAFINAFSTTLYQNLTLYQRIMRVRCQVLLIILLKGVNKGVHLIPVFKKQFM